MSEDQRVGTKTISVRPRKSAEEKILRLAAELDKSAGQLLADAAEAIVAMVESPEPRIPRMVTAARVLRENDATFTAKERLFNQISIEDQKKLQAKKAEMDQASGANGKPKVLHDPPTTNELRKRRKKALGQDDPPATSQS